ncbi:histone acetyltransferase HAC12-like isoform X2 [Rhodamnia argentea]|uniref:histone acetyltransferase n=1 Tax=Rhodamnia argentea TaxID=178133 RepID=A0ABM3HSM3_9MYRT|nr:histone acetyltransferase HAC12-like isoform X2 [Rhodamnia argentea]
MLGKAYLLGQHFGQNRNSFFPNSFLQSRGNVPPQGFARSAFRDWRKNPQISWCRDLVRRRIMEVFPWIMNVRQDWESLAVGLAYDLEENLFMESASEVEYMNLETLNIRLEILLARMIAKSNTTEILDESATSSFPMSSIVTSAGSFARGSSNAPNAPLSDLNNHNVAYDAVLDRYFLSRSAVGLKNVNLPKQSGSAGADWQGINEVIIGSDNGPMHFPADAADTVSLIMETSSSLIYSDHISRNAAAYGGSVFPHVSSQCCDEALFKDYSMEKQFNLQQNLRVCNQHSVKPVNPSESQVLSDGPVLDYFTRSSQASEPRLLELPSYQLPSAFPWKGTLPSSFETATNAESSYPAHGHACQCIDCFFGGLRAQCSRPKSGSPEITPPCSKRQKMDVLSCFPSSKVGTSVLDPVTAQDYAAGRLPGSQNLPQSTICVQRVMVLGTKPSTSPSANTQATFDTIKNLLHRPFVPIVEIDDSPSKELLNTSVVEDLDHIGIGSTIADHSVDSVEERSSSPHTVFEEHGADTEEVGQFGIDLGDENREVENKTLAMMEVTDWRAESEKSKIKGVSLMEFFTKEQIKEHIAGLKRCVHQVSEKDIKNDLPNSTRENSCQLCGAVKLVFAPSPIYCSSCSVLIKRNGFYYCMPNEIDVQCTFCPSCHNCCRGGTIKCGGISVSKAKLHKRKNNEEIEESWVQCDKCGAWQHQICALFNDKRNLGGKAEYICPICSLNEMGDAALIPPLKVGILRPGDLPRTKLSDYLEQRIQRRLKEEREQRAKVSRKGFFEVPGAEDLVVRVVVSAKRKLEVKKHFLDTFPDLNYPAEFPYCSKVILLFQKIEGVDILIFGAYAQEFGSDCGHPNQRCVYISYLDSVKYFRPEVVTVTGESLRTFVYHELLIGYLECCKQRGFSSCFIWACPPLKGEDYLFYCHPETQKTPHNQKLRKWYQSMLHKAVEENIVISTSNLYDHYFLPPQRGMTKITAARLPYFEGDYWSASAENLIKDIEQKDVDDSQKKGQKISSRFLKAMGHKSSSDGSKKDILFMQKLGEKILPAKEDFIVVHLQFVCSHCREVILSTNRWFCSQCKNFQLCKRCHDTEQLLYGTDIHMLNEKVKHSLSEAPVNGVPSDTEDEDTTLENYLFESRHTFLKFCQENQYQFNTLRHAKYSSMMILHYLGNPKDIVGGASCSICRKLTALKQSWRCEICPEFSVCQVCYQHKNFVHDHRLTPGSSNTDQPDPGT